MSSRCYFPILSIVFVFTAQIAFSQIIWQENFSGANQGWTDNFTDCDGNGSAGVNAGRFEVVDMEGTPCCPAGASTGGGNNNEWVTNEISIQDHCNISISVQYGFVGTFECSAGGPYFACTNDPFIDNGHDQMVFEYSLNSGPWIQFQYVCGGQTGTATITGLNGNTIRVRILPANKSTAETYWFDNVTVSGTAAPTVNPVNDVVVCSGQPVSVMFSGTGTPPITYAWTNDNPAIGLGASGNGNLNFPTPAGITSPQVANITVTPSSAGCMGTPETFTITVNPPPTVDDPPNITVCPGDALSVVFTGSSPTATYNWSASLPIPGGGASGTGDINVPVIPFIPFPVTVTVTVTASENGCTGPAQTFTISAFPSPTANLTLTGSANICVGQNATFSVSFMGGAAPYTFIYAIDGVNQAPITTSNNPYVLNVPLNTSGTVSLVEVTSNGCSGTGSGSANITVNPAPTATISNGSGIICVGQNVELEVTLDGTGPFTFVYRINGINQPPITTPGPTYNINFTPNNPGVYNFTLFSVTANGCTGTVSGAYSFTANTAPTATIIGSPTICAGQTANLTVDFTGTGPFTFNWTADGVLQTPITTSNDPFTLSVMPTTTTLYELVDVNSNGCVGTVQGLANVTVNPSPTATLTSGTGAVCNGQSLNLTITFTGPGPYSFVYAVNGVNQPAINTPLSTYTLVVSPTVPSTYTLFSVTGGGCSGTVGGTYTVTVGTSPTAAISGDTMICPGGTASLPIAFTGTAPFTFVYTANGIKQPAITTSNNPYILNVMPTSTTAYELDSLNSNGCEGTLSGTATVNIAPTVSATISGGGQICTSDTSGVDIMVNFLGTGPYTFIYTANNVPQLPPITTNSNPYIFNVNPSIGTTYRLDSVSNGMCGGMISGQAVVSVFTPPTANLTGSQTFCDSADTNVMIDFTGTGPFTVIYTIDGVAQEPDTTFDDPYLIPISTSTTTVVELISVESPGCDGIPQGTATITVNYAPSYSNLNLNCNIAVGTYTVTFDVLGATLPLTLVTGSGTFTGTQFTSSPISIGTPYNFAFHDANDCSDVTVSGASNCNCVTNAGTMNLTPIEVCIGQTATATYNGVFTDDGNDILRYILHTNPALPIGTILGWNTTPSFNFGPGMTAGVTYYISAIAGDNDGMGNVALNDPCLSVSQGTPVTFFSLPTANLGLGDTICAGAQAIIPVTLTGIAPFSLTWALNGVPQPTAMNIPTSSYQLVISPIANTVVTLISVGDSRCSTPATDTAYIGVNTSPQVSNLAVNCNFATQTYTVTFDLTGVSPFNISGTSGIFNGNQFTSDPIPTSSPNYVFNISDANMCGQTTLADSAACGCITNAGTMDQIPVIVCENAMAVVPAANNPTLDPDDQLLYILHSNPGNPPGTIFAWSAIPQFTFQPGMMSNTTYYISSVAGNPGTPGQIDLNDPCLSIATGTPIQFHALPLAELVAIDTSVCPGEPLTLLVNFTGAPPFGFTYSVNTVAQTPVTGINTSPYGIFLNPSVATIVELNSVSDQYCANGTVTGTVNITMNTTPQITNVQTVCDSIGQNYAVNFEILNGVAPYNVSGITGNVIGNQFFGNAIIPSGTSYSITLSDANLCGVTFIIGSFSCDCITNAGSLNQTPLTLCAGEMAVVPVTGSATLDANDALVYLLVTTPTPSTWTILATNNVPEFNFIPGTMSPNTAYYVVAVAGNASGNTVDLNDPCLNVATGPTITWRAPVMATISGPAAVCAGSQTNLTVQFSGDGPFTFIYNNNGQQTPITTSQNPYSLNITPASGATSINLVSVTGAGSCAGAVSGSVAVTPTPQILNLQTICDLVTQTYILQFDVSNGAAPNTTYTVTGVTGSFTDSTFTSTPIPGPDPYSVTVTTPAGCSATAAGEGGCVCNTDAGTLSAVTADACLPSGLVTVQTNGDQTIEANDLLLYILYQNPAQLPLSIIAVSPTPSFGFQTGMTAGTTYFISAIAGNNNGAGSLDLTDPCLSISPGIPVTFHDAPTAALSGNSSFCAGGNAVFQIQFTGTAPFKFVYAINGNAQPQITAPGNTFNISTNNVQQMQTFTLVSVEDAFCIGTVSGSATVDIIPPPTGQLIGDATVCAGNTATLGLVLNGGTAYDVTISGEPNPIVLTGVQDGATVDVTPNATTTYTITALTATGNACPPDIGLGATITVSDLSATATVSDYNGFGISCPNGDDGYIEVTVTGGIAPVVEQWSNSASGLVLDDLGPGTYSLTLTDAAGCTFQDSFLLIAPPGLSIDVTTISPSCFGESNGSLTVQSVQGGAKPFTIDLNGASFLATDTFPATIGLLEAGDYLLEIADANGCITEENVNLPAPPQLIVNLGSDITVSFGDSIVLEAMLNMTEIDTFSWSPVDFMSTPDSLATVLKPTNSQIYTFTATDTMGCVVREQVQVVVIKEHRIYLPNIIRPASIELNDAFTVYTGAEVSQVRRMQIYDRWGELLFENKNFAPNDPLFGWRGNARGKQVNPGVYVYVVEVEFFDGSTEVISGDVTVMR